MRFVLLIALILYSSIAIAAVEDLSTYTIGGTDSAYLSANETSVTASSSMKDNNVAYAYYDYGANYFGEFDIDFKTYTAVQGSSSLLGFFCLSNTATVSMGGMNTADDGLCVQFHKVGDDGYSLRNYTDNTGSSTIAGAAYETRYITITRVGGEMTLNLFTDSGRTTHASGSPITLTVPTTKYRYLYAWATGGTDGWASSTSAGTTSDIEIVQADSSGEESERRIFCAQ